MKTGQIIAAIGVTAAVGALGYLGYKKFIAQPSAPVAPAGTTPSGTTPTGVQTYINQAGQLVDGAGKLINNIQNIIPKSDYEGQMVRVAKKDVFLIQNGLQRYIRTTDIVNRYGGWGAVHEVNNNVAPMGTDLSGLQGLGCGCEPLGGIIVSSKLLR